MRPEHPFPEWVAPLRSGFTAPQAHSSWTPPMDVLERPDGLEIRVDVAGIPATALAITVRGQVLYISGDKGPAGCHSGATFHVAERTCGRFLRVVPLRMAFQTGAIRATLRNGELRIVVPRAEERRGIPIPIPIETLDESPKA